MYCRVVRSKLDPNRIDDSIRGGDGPMVPTFKKQPGFAGQTATMNRATGDALTVTYWESEKAMQDSRPEVMAAAQKFLQAVGGEMVEQVDCEVAVLERFQPARGGRPRADQHRSGRSQQSQRRDRQLQGQCGTGH